MKIIKISLNLDFFLIEKVNIKLKEFKEINTNKVIDDSLFYTERYIKWNKKNVKDVLDSKNCNGAFYKDFDSFLALSKILDSQEVSFDIKKSVPTKVLDILIKKSNLRILSCYFMPSDYIHDFSLREVSVKFINDILFTPSFVSSNNLKNLKSIYYKKVIRFNTLKEFNDNFEHFVKVNQNLKLIHLYFYSNDTMSFIVKKLEECNIKDASILIHQNDENINDISNGEQFLRKLNKKYSNNDREIKIIYSNKFFRDNIFRELTINGIKLCMIAVFYVGIVIVISDKYQEYVTVLNLRMLESSLGEVIDNDMNIDEIEDSNVNPPEEVSTPAPDSNEEAPVVYVNHYANIPTSFDRLKQINSEVVGWVSVNNSKINYPVTQHSDNKYYLEYDIYNRKVITGWIFMDYRNDPNFGDANTIVYGHNTISGYMFGDLKNTAVRDWYTNPDNQIITFKTLERELHFKIFSIYKTDYTTDYLQTAFYNNDYYMDFINLIKSRSIYNFNVDVGVNDKILTLSSCTGGANRRVVVHAVLIS